MMGLITNHHRLSSLMNGSPSFLSSEFQIQLLLIIIEKTETDRSKARSAYIIMNPALLFFLRIQTDIRLEKLHTISLPDHRVISAVSPAFNKQTK